MRNVAENLTFTAYKHDKKNLDTQTTHLKEESKRPKISTWIRIFLVRNRLNNIIIKVKYIQDQ